jgi:hypothetical protein
VGSRRKKINMTQFEIYNTIKSAMFDNADVVEFCDRQLAAIERKRAKTAEKQAFLDEIYAALKSFDEPTTSKAVALHMGENVSSRKVAANMRFLVEDGRAEKVAVNSKTFTYKAL